MNIGPSGFAGSVAGGHLTHGQSEIDRAKQDTSNQSRQVSSEKRAEQSSGIGETEGDQETSDRDGDGQKLWEETTGDGQNADEKTSGGAPPRSKDPSGSSGSRLDISG